ncbi:MAG: phage tail tape measure protein [Pyramidobacter sp.]|nr:phage tail tape measure protein [Pyramidobacter sp.]
MTGIQLGMVLTLKDQASRALQSVMSKVKQTKDVTKEMISEFESAGKSMLYGAGMIVGGSKLLSGALGGPLMAAASLETEMAKVGTIAGTSAEGMKQLQKEVERLSVSYGKSQEEMARGLYGTISAGITDAKEATKALDVASKMAVAGATTTDTAINGLTSVLNAYHLSADEAINVSDAMFTAMKRGKTTMEELASSMGAWTGNAAALGVSYKEALGTIAAATLPGMSTQIASMGLRSLLDAYAKPQKAAVEAAKEYGLELSTAAIKTKGLYGVLKEVNKLPEDVISRIFTNTRTATFVKNVMSGAGEALISIMADMEKAEGATNEAFEKVSSTFQFRLNVMNSAMELFRKRLGATLLKPVGYVVEAIGRFFFWLSQLPEPIHAIITSLTSFVGIGMIAMGSLIAVAVATKMWRLSLIFVQNELALLKEHVGNMMKALGGMTPMLMGIAAAAGFVYLAWKNNWGGLRDTVEGVMAGLKMAISAGTDGIARVDKATADRLKKLGIWEFAIAAGRVFYRIRMFFTGFVEGLKTFAQLVKKYISEAGDTFRWLWEPVFEFGRKILELFGFVNAFGADSVKQTGGSVGVFVGMLLTGLVALKSWKLGLGLLKGAFAPVLGMFKLGKLLVKGLTSKIVKNIAGWIAEKTVMLAHAAASKIAAAGQWLLNTSMLGCPVVWLVAGLAAVVAGGWYLYKNWDKISKGLGKAWDWIKGKASAAKDWIVGKWNDLVGWFSGIPGMISAAAANMWQGVKEKAQTAKDWVVSKWEALCEWFSGLPGKIAGSFSGIGDALKDQLNSARQWFAELASGDLAEKAAASFSALWSKVKNGAAEAYKGWLDIWEGIVVWFKDLPNRIMDAIASLKDRFIKFFADLWDKITPDFGKWFGIDKKNPAYEWKPGETFDEYKARTGAQSMANDLTQSVPDALDKMLENAKKGKAVTQAAKEMPDTSQALSNRPSQQGAIAAAQTQAVVEKQQEKPVQVKTETKVMPGKVVVELNNRAIGEAAVDYMAEQHMLAGSTE